jgi:tRNA (guanine37-N1)-methyltransferase
MRVGIVTLFPELFDSFLRTSFVGRAIAGGQLEVHLEALRDHGLGKHRSVDDRTYGGGSGMLLRVDCMVSALERIDEVFRQVGPAHRVLLTPQGAPFSQAAAAGLAQRACIAVVCGRYEGFDERIRAFVDVEISLGDFVLTGGEVAAMALLEASVRLLPGVLGNQASARQESFGPACEGILEYPQYTRPACFRGLEVPEVLLGGDHARVAGWRREQAVLRTRRRRPELLDRGSQPTDPEAE